MGDHPMESLTEWEIVQRKLDGLLFVVPSPSGGPGVLESGNGINTRWHELPRSLAERGLVLKGLPAVCEPIVRADRVCDPPLAQWPHERISALRRALDLKQIVIVPREPLSRRVIFELVDEDGTRRDASSTAFSEDWHSRFTFNPRIYAALTSNVLRDMNMEGLTRILQRYIPNPGQIPWISLPAKLWSSRCYLSGMPRICMPAAVGDKIPKDSPTPSARWRKDQRIALQRVLDTGILKLRERSPERNVIFEVLEEDGSLVDDDCGFSQQWKLMHMTNTQPDSTPQKVAKITKQRNGHVRGPSTPTATKRRPTLDTIPKRMFVIERYISLLAVHNLLLDAGPDGPAWIYVPQMLATKRMFVLGLPSLCLPIVKEDVVVANYDPRQWSPESLEAFIQASQAGQIQVLHRQPGDRVLYRVLDDTRDTPNDTIGFSEEWCRENLDIVNIFDPSIPLERYVTEMWLNLLDSTGIPCHDHRGRRRIPWAQLPMFLAHRRLFISGCPIECIPKVENDVVSEMSSPYFYNRSQLLLMRDAFAQRKVLVRSRGPQRDVLFTHEVGGFVHDLTCGFSHSWVHTNLHTVPESLSKAPPPWTPYVPLPTPTLTNGPTPKLPIKDVSMRDVTEIDNVFKKPLDTPFSASKPASPISEPSPPLSPTTSASIPPSPATHTPNSQSNTNDKNDSRSLKIIIPAHKRRHLSSSGNTEVAEVPSDNAREVPRAATVAAITPPKPPLRTLRPSATAPSTPRPSHPLRQTVSNFDRRYPRRRHTLPTPPSPISSSSSSEGEEPGRFGMRESMSPPLPPSSTLPDPLPPVPLPSFLPRPGGNLGWNDQRSVWELTVSEQWPPKVWESLLPCFPARILWNPIQKVWMCEPSESLRSPQIGQGVGVSSQTLMELESSRAEGPPPQLEPGLSIIWHRWRRTWGLFEYVAPIPS
ncbi:hypothetical protein CPB86DRAFT_807023 [Serendipita vermifera]|nr:hypothetical protein CPB86DRAFT_807023 [Serendipita vermifera]